MIKFQLYTIITVASVIDNELVSSCNLLKSRLGDMASHFTCQQPTSLKWRINRRRARFLFSVAGRLEFDCLHV